MELEGEEFQSQAIIVTGHRTLIPTPSDRRLGGIVLLDKSPKIDYHLISVPSLFWSWVHSTAVATLVFCPFVMAPVLNHPTGVTFVDDHDFKPVNVDAATYYGGGESYTRSRTYSHVGSAN